jgi:hypothetical protein
LAKQRDSNSRIHLQWISGSSAHFVRFSARAARYAESPDFAEEQSAEYTDSMKTIFLKYRLECIAAGSGAIVMILELVGARMVAPFFGTSLYVWTAIIGVILGALSFGYWYGGRLADRGATAQGLMKIIVLAAASIAFTMFIQERLLRLTAGSIGDVRLSALLASLVLFAPAAVLLGIVSPYLVRLKLASLSTAGASVGRLYAAGTFGSIVGTFLAGYWLISWFGNRQLGLGLVLALILLSFGASVKGWWLQRVLVLVGTGIGFATIVPLAPQIIADVDSAYSRYLVTETPDKPPVRGLIMDPFSVQSAQYVGDPDTLFFNYTQRFMNVVDGVKPARTLVVGGGAFTFPLAVARAYPETDVTAVEIDPALTRIATDYFSLRERANLHIKNEDGRVFLNRPLSGGAYRAVFMDAFSSMTPPYQLTTTEAVGRIKALLTPNGVVVANIIAIAENSPYLSAVTATYRQHFKHVEVYQLSPEVERAYSQNLLIVASNDDATSRVAQASLKLGSVPVASTHVLTDDHAPVEQLIERQ